MAERPGFEPAVGLLALRRVSKPLVSATHPPLRFMACETHRTEPLSRDKPAAASPSAGLAPVATGAPTGSAAHSSGRSATHPPLREIPERAGSLMLTRAGLRGFPRRRHGRTGRVRVSRERTG